jgi:hypothetical protein
MKFPTTVNCIVFSFGYAESNQVPAFIFSTDFFEVKNYSPAEALVTLADDWYHWYLEELNHRKMMLAIKCQANYEPGMTTAQAVLDIWNHCNPCCLEAHNLGREYCGTCQLKLQVEPEAEDFYDFLSFGHGNCITDGFWDEYMSGHTPSWDPFWKECGLHHILKGEFLSIMESAEGVFVAALQHSGRHPEVFNLKEPARPAALDALLDDIRRNMEDL